MRKLTLLSALFIFACSSDDGSNDNDNNNNIELLNCDGNPVPTIVYGTQEWTVENTCHITYRDGTPIPEVTNTEEWANLTTGAWCYYDNDPTKPILYNGYAVMGIHDTDPNTPNKEFAPEGWHVASDTEWTTLANYLVANGYNYDGTTTGYKIAKSMASTTGWDSSTNTGVPGNDQSSNNSSGFNAFPIGNRTICCTFINEGEYATFWTSTVNNVFDDNESENWRWHIGSVSSSIFHGGADGNNNYGFSVRLVKD